MYDLVPKPRLSELLRLTQAAAVVDIKAWATDSFEGNIAECMASMSDFISVYAVARKKPESFVAQAEAQMSAYINKQGHFSQQTVINKAKLIPPHVFFDTQGATIPQFAEVALRLATKDTKFIWTKGRNRMTQEKVEMSKHRYSALRRKVLF